ncbi:MAG: mechanosensitive ion channel family protein [Candidatus Bathyarchaeota archaeon]|nr:mechanosensitive ion channel family protein [Candidatus Bathyarchaeota archaeon]
MVSESRFCTRFMVSSTEISKNPHIISRIIERMELAELDRVHFREFGDFSLNFEVVYHMKTPDCVRYRDTQQDINFAIVEAFEKEGIQMTFRTQTIHLNK